MTLTKELMTDTAMASAAELAEKLGLKQVPIGDVTEFWNNRPILIATPTGTNIGAIRVRLGDTRTGQLVEYFLNDTLLATEKIANTEDGWADDSTIESYVEKGAIVYLGDEALSTPKVLR